jgi:hypothetical protein
MLRSEPDHFIEKTDAYNLEDLKCNFDFAFYNFYCFYGHVEHYFVGDKKKRSTFFKMERQLVIYAICY